MNITPKYNIHEDTTEFVSMFTSAIVDYLLSIDVDPKDAIVSICAECPKTELDESIVKASLSNFVGHGFMYDNNFYDAFAVPASKGRQATSVWMRHDLLSLVGRWAMCGLQTKNMKLALNKYLAYIGLLFSASKKFKDEYGVEIKIHRVAVIKDFEVVVEGIVDVVAAERGVTHEVARKMVINAFDGFGIIRKSITKGESVTIRGPWLKAFVQSIDWSKLFAFCCERGINPVFKDFWGNEFALKDVDIILTESCFKTIKLYESWEQYCEAFETLGHEIRVCVHEHAPRLKGLPYQQAQTLIGSEDDALHFAIHAKKTVYKYHDMKNAVKLLRGSHQQAARMYPALMTECHTKRAMQEMYTTKRNDMLGGRIPDLGYNAFLAPDLVAFAEHLFGLEVKGFLKAGECYCSAAKPGLVDVTRSPHLDNAHVLMNNVESCPLAEGPTMFINIFDTTTIQLRADYDGDHVWYSQDEYLLGLVERTYETLKNIPIDWDVAKAEKVQITKSGIASFIVNLIHGSEIGLYADALTKMWNHGYDRDVCDWLTFAANVLIDAAKHAAVKIQKPDAVKALNNISLPLFAMYAKADMENPVYVERVVLAPNREYKIGHVIVRDDKTFACINNHKTSDNGEFRADCWKEYNGFDAHKRILNPYWVCERTIKTRKGEIRTLPPRCADSGSFVDMYSKFVDDEIEETLKVDGLEDELFDVSVMCIDFKRKIGKLAGLSKKGIYNEQTGKFDGCGIFQDIAFRHSQEWSKLVGDMSFFAHRSEWEAETAKVARKEIIDWARAQYDGAEGVSDERIEDACYDIIVRHIFQTKMSDGMDTVIKQAFWRIYGEKCVSVLKKNLDATIPDFDSEEFEELFDVSED